MGLYISDAAIHIYHKSLPSLLQLLATGINNLVEVIRGKCVGRPA